MTSVESPIERLSDDFLSVILHLVSQSDGQFLQHALVCKKWHRVACRVHDHIHIRENRRMCPRDLLSHLSSFPRLRKLVLARNSLTHIPDSLLSHLAATCSELTELHICFEYSGSPHRITAIPDSIGGLSSLTKLSLRIPSALCHVVRLPDALASLQSLTHLELRTLSLLELPQNIGDLISLKLLKLTGMGPCLYLPESLGRLTVLERLLLSGDMPRDEIHLPGSIINLSSLKTLEISRCFLANPLPENIGDLQALEALRLHHVYGITALPENIGDLQALEALRLDDVYGITALPETLGQLQHLQELFIDCPELESIPDSLSHLPSLTSFTLEARGHLRLPNDIWQLSKLRTLVLRDTTLEQPPRSIARVTSLQALTLGENEAVTSLPEDFGQLTALETLELLCPDRLTSLAGFLHLTNLKELSIVSCGHLELLPTSLSQLPFLEVLKIMNCDRLIALPDGFAGGLQSLKKLTLWELPLLRTLPAFRSALSLLQLKLRGMARLRSLPDSVCHLSALQTLEIADCRKLSALPEALGELPSLEVLWLEYLNRLRKLPDSFGQLKRLDTLRIFKCKRLVRLPESFSNLSCLEELCILENIKISCLPGGFGQLSSLKRVTLHGLDSLRSLPDSILQLPRLEELCVRRCKKLARLPPNLQGMPRLLCVVEQCPRLRGWWCMAQQAWKGGEVRGRIEGGGVDEGVEHDGDEVLAGE